MKTTLFFVFFFLSGCRTLIQENQKTPKEQKLGNTPPALTKFELATAERDLIKAFVDAAIDGEKAIEAFIISPKNIQAISESYAGENKVAWKMLAEKNKMPWLLPWLDRLTNWTRQPYSAQALSYFVRGIPPSLIVYNPKTQAKKIHRSLKPYLMSLEENGIAELLDTVLQKPLKPLLDKDPVARPILRALTDYIDRFVPTKEEKVSAIKLIIDSAFEDSNGRIRSLEEVVFLPRDPLSQESRELIRRIDPDFQFPPVDSKPRYNQTELVGKAFVTMLDKVAGPSGQKLIQNIATQFPPEMKKEIKRIQTDLEAIKPEDVKVEMEKLARQGVTIVEPPPDMLLKFRQKPERLVDNKLYRIGTATMGGAYQAWIKDKNGNVKQVVIKLQKPRMQEVKEKEEKIVESLLEDLNKKAETPESQDSAKIISKYFNAYQQTVAQEIDFRNEAASLDELKKNQFYNGVFDVEQGTSGLKSVEIDVVRRTDIDLGDLAKTTLIMDMAPGKPLGEVIEETRAKFDDAQKALNFVLKSAGWDGSNETLAEYSKKIKGYDEYIREMDTALKKSEHFLDIMKTVHSNYTKAFFMDGVLHGDPHGGNIFLSEVPGRPPKITYIDAGGSHKIPKSRLRDFIRISRYGEKNDLDRVVQALNSLRAGDAEVSLSLKARLQKTLEAGGPSSKMMNRILSDIAFDPNFELSEDIKGMIRAQGILDKSALEAFSDFARFRQDYNVVATQKKPLPNLKVTQNSDIAKAEYGKFRGDTLKRNARGEYSKVVVIDFFDSAKKYALLGAVAASLIGVGVGIGYAIKSQQNKDGQENDGTGESIQLAANRFVSCRILHQGLDYCMTDLVSNANFATECKDLKGVFISEGGCALDQSKLCSINFDQFGRRTDYILKLGSGCLGEI